MTIVRLEPVAEQVEKLLRKRIENGNYAPDNRLPSEAELAAEYGVSRATIRAALSVLSAEHLVVRKPGIGTFVNEHITQLFPNFDSLWEHSYLIKKMGKTPSIKTLSTTVRPATEAEARALDINLDEKVYVLERLFLADNEPLVFSHNIIPIKLFRGPLVDLETDIEIRQFAKKYCEQEVSHVIADVGSALPKSEVADALELDENTPVLHFIQVFYTEDSLPAVYAVNLFNDKLLRLRIARVINLSNQEDS